MYRYWKRFSEITRQELEDRIQNFISSSPRKPTLFCVNCGSTDIEQYAISELGCRNCDQRFPWNGLRFSIARPNQGVDDVAFSLRALLTSSYDEWHREIEDRLWNFQRRVVEDARKSEEFTLERLEKLEREWEASKKAIDMYFQDRRKVEME